MKYAVSNHHIWEILAPYDCPPGYHWASTTEGLELLEFEGMVQDGDRDYPMTRRGVGTSAEDIRPYPRMHPNMWERNITEHTWLQRQESAMARHGEYEIEMVYKDQCGWDELWFEGKERQYFRFSDSGPRYMQFLPSSGAEWPEEGYFFRGDYPTSTISHPQDMDVYHSHITAWYW